MKKNRINIVFTGGHAGTTAIALQKEIKKQNLNWKIHWIGPKKSIEGKNIFTLEYKYFNKYEIEFHSIDFPKLQRKLTLLTILSFLKIPFGFIEAFYLMLRIKPAIVISFGGFASFPVIVVSKLLNFPIVIHEQTSAAGKSNIVAAKFADKILLSRETSKKYFPAEKSVLVGNPVLLDKQNILTKPRINNIKTIMIVGGSRGSQIVNKAVEDCLDSILENYHVIHVTGDLDFERFKEVKNLLNKDKLSNYTIFSSVEPQNMENLYKEADLVISRAGANTVSELVTLGIPSIFIPIPWSYLNEQKKNAEYASKYINSTIVDQNLMEKGDLLTCIKNISSNLDDKKLGNSFDLEASNRIINLLTKFIK